MKAAIILFCCFILGCGSHDASTGNANVSISAASLSTIAKVTVTVSGPGMTDMSTDLGLVGSSWQGSLDNIPVGPDRVFTAIAYDGSHLPLYQGTSAPTEIIAGATAVVVLALQSTNPPPSFGNHAPHIDSLIASSQTVAPGGTIALQASATDADGDPLMFAWSSASGAFSNSSAELTDWTAPATEGDATLTFVATDPDGAQDGISIVIHVTSSAAKGSASVSVGFNSFPQVTNLTLNISELYGNATATATTTAIDPDGDALSFTYSDDCGGTWSGAQVQFPSVLPPGPSCVITVTVEDGRGGTNYGSLTVSTITNDLLVDLFVSSTSADNFGKVTLHVRARTDLHLQFSASGGALAGDVDQIHANYAEVTWTAPLCFAAPVTITALAEIPGNPATETSTWTISPVGSPCGLVADWDGDSYVDTVGGRVATANTVFFTPGVHGNAYHFAQPYAGLTASDAGLPSGNADRTVDMWVRIDTMYPFQNYFFGYGYYGIVTGAFTMGYQNDVDFVSDWGYAVTGGNGLLPAGTGWHHVATTVASSVYTLYIDGHVVGSGSMATDTVLNGSVTIGSLTGTGDGQTHYLNGALDDIRVWNRALSADEIAFTAAGN